MARIAIIGLGLIGGSIGMALVRAIEQAKGSKDSKTLGLRDIEVVGHDKDPDAMAGAKKRNAVHKTEWNLHSCVEGAGMVIIATPVLTVRQVMLDIVDDLAEGAIVTDTASTKGQVMEWAAEILPSYVSFIGGHPMAGKELSGINAAEADLFKDAVWCLCPSVTATAQAITQVENLVGMMGATIYSPDPHEHDGLVAGVSHLPIVVSAALVSSVVDSSSWREMRKVAAGGFRDVSRLASGEPTMNLDICMTNKRQVVSWLDRYIEELQRYRGLIVDGGEPLAREFLHVQEERDNWLYGNKDVDETGEQIKKSMSISSMIFGERLSGLTGYMNQTGKKDRKRK